MVITSGTSIGNSAFYNCNGLTSIIISNSVINIDDYAFYGCSGLSSITIPDSVTNIGKYAFSGCSGLTSITIPDSVTSIDDYAFRNCSRTTTIVLPNSINSIGIGAFQYCSRLENLTIPFVGKSRNATAYESVFGYIFGYTTRVDSGSPTVNSTADAKDRESTAFCNKLASGNVSEATWQYSCYNSYGDYYFIKLGFVYEGVTHVDYEIKKGYRLQSYYYYIPNSLKNVTVTGTFIRAYAFFNCKNLKNVTIPDSVTSIGSYAFYGCSGLKTVLYAGTEEQWKAISIGSDNSALTSATRVYNYDGVERTYSFVTNCDQSVDPITATYLTSLPTLTRDGFCFGGWYDNEAFEGKSVSAPYCNKDKTTLYAKWLTEEEWNALKDGTTFAKAYIAERGQTYDVTITTVGQIVYFAFTPTTSGSFTIQSIGSGDTYGTLYSSSKSSLKTSDDDGDGRNFKVTYTMTAGTTYYVAVKFYGSSATGTFKVRFS